MAYENSDNYAVMNGYTREVYVEADFGGFAALVKPDTDFDDKFRAFDTDNQEWMTVYGWNVSVTDAGEM